MGSFNINTQHTPFCICFGQTSCECGLIHVNINNCWEVPFYLDTGNKLCMYPMITNTLRQHYNEGIMGAISSQITSLTIVYTIIYSEPDQRKHQSFASLAFVWGIHRGPVNSPHKWPVTREVFPFDDVIMIFDGHGRFIWYTWYSQSLTAQFIASAWFCIFIYPCRVAHILFSQ